MAATDPRPLPFAVFDEFGKPADDRVQDHIYAALSEVLGDSQPVAPWLDHSGQTIRHGDRLLHPFDGIGFTAVRLNGYQDEGDAWRAIYDDATVSRLCLQIGDKGRAVLALPQRAEPATCPECGGALQWRCPACKIAQSRDVAEPASVQAPSRNATERARAWETSPGRVHEVLRELVDGLERTNWSSWQTTAHFSTQLAAAQNLLAAIASQDMEQRASGPVHQDTSSTPASASELRNLVAALRKLGEPVYAIGGELPLGSDQLIALDAANAIERLSSKAGGPQA